MLSARMAMMVAISVAKSYTNKECDRVERAGFKAVVMQDRSILQSTGQYKILYFLPKTTSKPQDGYDEFIYTSDNQWEEVGHTDIDLSAYATMEWVLDLIQTAAVDENGHLTFTLPDGTVVDAGDVTGPQGKSAYDVAVDEGFVGDAAAWIASLKGDPGNNYVLTEQDKQDVAQIVYDMMNPEEEP